MVISHVIDRNTTYPVHGELDKSGHLKGNLSAPEYFDMSVKLTQGAIEALFNESHVKDPVLQVLNLREYPSTKGPSKYRLNLSDGVHMLSSFLMASQLNHLVESQQLTTGCVCKLKKITATYLSNKQVLVLLDMEVLQTAEETGGKIGNPKQLNAREVSDMSTSVAEPSVFDETPGPSAISMTTHGQVLRGNSPMKLSPMKASEMAAPAQASPREMSAIKGSPMQASPMKMLPIKGSPMQATHMPPSPMKESPIESPSPSKSPTKVVPIERLNPYVSNWTIRARVTSKSNIRQWSNSRGEGKVFSFDIVDESGEIKITAFNKEVDKFFSLVEQNKVFLISKGSLKVANKQFNSLKNKYELEDIETDAIVDVIGVCEEVEDVSVVNTKAGKQIQKRVLMLTDSSGKMVALTLWGDEAQNFNTCPHPVVAIKGARLSDFGGRSLSALFSSTLMVNPDITEAFKLRAWYNQVGHSFQSQSLTATKSMGEEIRTNWKSLNDIKAEQMGHSEKADYFSCVATVVYMRKENCLYQACATASCNKKVVEQNGRYHCEKCNKDFPNFKYRFILIVNLADFGDNQWATCFQETAEALLGHSAEALGHLKDTDEDAFNEVFQKVSYTTHIFKNRVKLETYNDESRVKVTVLEVHPVDHRQYSRRLLANIRTLSYRT
ncbi:replication protein A 70 kDa DNA-binding subunit-like isoform X2 [Dunckerocampus dactyliophorus]|uniref:replication protein A 70 kDa DNA-binding subunit-like isoform X2 n=1 Tax=Dunckerocampus dactyliophorus TaxID=161453 RepID=UPI00240622BD|nr:replication protein A 70 kDa DNA-binding subunit-like isoform X2 [Dunckerocampus dactyliophorus]